jgi:hypothetical protein
LGDSDWEAAPCVTDGNVPRGVDVKYVSQEFRALNQVGVAVYTVLTAVAMGHFFKPLRFVTKIFGSLIWLFIFLYFVTANVYRFREAGRACSLDYLNTNEDVTCEDYS